MTLPPFPFSTLIDWYSHHDRHDLPWRQYDLPADSRIYRVWLSEILLQQTQASRVVGFFDRILDHYPTIEDLARTSYEEFFPYYQGLGYYSRARNLLKTASIITDEYGGVFPSEKETLMRLPGVGSYTAEAILAFGYGLPHLAWDTNLEKLFARYYHGSREQRLSREEKVGVERQFQGFIEGITNDEGGMTNTRSVNNALMDYAALVESLPTESRDWESYIFKDSRYYQTRGSLETVERKITKNFPTPDAQIIVVLHQDHREYFSTREESQERNIWAESIISRLVGEMRISSDSVITTQHKHIHFSILSEKDEGEIPRARASCEASLFSPFLLPPAMSRDIRAYIKSHFLQRYTLHLSVRPPRERGITEEGIPYIVCFAQPQTGTIPTSWKRWTKKKAS